MLSAQTFLASRYIQNSCEKLNEGKANQRGLGRMRMGSTAGRHLSHDTVQIIWVASQIASTTSVGITRNSPHIRPRWRLKLALYLVALRANGATE